MIEKTLVLLLFGASVGYAGYLPPTNGYVFHQNPIYQTAHPVFQNPLVHYAEPSYFQFQRPQQVTTINRPQFVAIQADRPPQHVTPINRPQFVAIQADRPQTQATTAKPPTLVQQYPGIVAIHAERPVQPILRKLVLPYPPAVYQPTPSYSYGYSVKDETTGDEKSHQETRTGDNVVGRYTVVEPDGTLRTVSYTAGKDGFNAVVERTANYARPNEPARAIPTKPFVVASPGYLKPFASAVAVPVSSNYPSGFHFGG